MAKLKPFTMPKWGIEMAEGTIADWMVAENAPFTRGTVLTLIETDKITNEVEAEADGRFVRILARAGETYPVGALLAVLSDGEEADPAEIDALVAGFKASDTSFDPDAGTDPAPAPAPVPVAAPPAPPPVPEGLAISPAALAEARALGVDLATVQGSGRHGRVSLQDVHQAARAPVAPPLAGPLPLTPEGPIRATPVARRLAALHELDLAKVAGTGPRGRVRRADVLAAIANARPAAAVAGAPQVVPMSAMRRTIARRLTQAKQDIPHFYVRRRVRADRLLAHRAAASGAKPSVNDYLIRACALALGEVPALNVQVHGQDIHQFTQADVSVAVATDRGLVTPIVCDAGSRSLGDIAATMQGLAARARAGQLRPEEFTGGSFSLSNLGSFGVEQFDAIINPPQGAILAVGAARPEPIEDDGALRIVPVLHLALSCDHRAIDGADAGRFMAALARLIEQPALLA